MTITDNDPAPPIPALALVLNAPSGRLQISLLAPATARFTLEASDDLFSWESWSTLTTNGLGQATLFENFTAPAATRLFFRAQVSP